MRKKTRRKRQKSLRALRLPSLTKRLKQRNNFSGDNLLISYILAVIFAVLLLGADQLTKYSVSTEFALGEQREFLKDLSTLHISTTAAVPGACFTEKPIF